MIKILQRKPQDTALVALDIGTESIKAAVFTTELRQSMTGEIVGKRAMIQGYSKVQLKNQSSPIADLATVIRQAKEAIATAAEKARIRPQQLVMGIGGEFVKGATTTISYTREDADSKLM